jgi:hypothetical protein
VTAEQVLSDTGSHTVETSGLESGYLGGASSESHAHVAMAQPGCAHIHEIIETGPEVLETPPGPLPTILELARKGLK